MNACILGTSNGIIADGYVKAIKNSELFSSVNNLSLGASSCAFFPYRLQEINWDKTNVIFVESLVNDAASARALAFNYLDIQLYYKDLIFQCKKHDVKVVSILLPGRTKDVYYDSCLATLREFLIEYQVEFWDIEKDILSYCDKINIDYMELYRDAAHPHSWFIYGVAERYLSQGLNFNPTHFNVPKYDQLLFTSINNDEFLFENRQVISKSIKTTLLSAESKVFSNNCSLKFECEFEFSLCAIVLNSNNTNCTLEIKGEKTLKKSLSFEIKENDDKLIVAPLLESVKSQNREINFTVTNDSEFSQKSYQANSTLISDPKLELVGFICQIYQMS
jgi:hypothetical protein